MRSFVAIRITDHNVINAIKDIQSEISADAKLVETKNLHFTLMFLGDIPNDTLSDITDAIKGIKFSQFDVSLIGCGAFPSARRAKAVWVGADMIGGARLIELAGMVKEALAPLGLSDDKTFKPHMTIFRMKKKAHNITDALKQHQKAHLGTQSVNSISLIKSVLTPEGPVYSDMVTVKAV